jgi:hypothetical protein
MIQVSLTATTFPLMLGAALPLSIGLDWTLTQQAAPYDYPDEQAYDAGLPGLRSSTRIGLCRRNPPPPGACAGAHAPCGGACRAQGTAEPTRSPRCGGRAAKSQWKERLQATSQHFSQSNAN